MKNIPDVKLGLIAVSRDCFPIALSEKRRAAIKAAYAGDLYECPVTVENELDMLKALAEEIGHGCTALVVFLGNFGPETPETLIAKNFDGHEHTGAVKVFGNEGLGGLGSAAEGDGDLKIGIAHV